MTPPENVTHVKLFQDGKATSIVVDGVVHVVEYDGDEMVGEPVDPDGATQEAGLDGGAFPDKQLQVEVYVEGCLEGVGGVCDVSDDLCDSSWVHLSSPAASLLTCCRVKLQPLPPTQANVPYVKIQVFCLSSQHEHIQEPLS